MRAQLSLESIARLLMQGSIGEANSQWNSLLPELAQQLGLFSPQQQQSLLPSLRSILSSQERQDWIAMADALRTLATHLDALGL